MKKILIAIWTLVLVFNYVDSNNKKNPNLSTEQTYKGPPMFVLTEMNGRELEQEAYFVPN